MMITSGVRVAIVVAGLFLSQGLSFRGDDQPAKVPASKIKPGEVVVPVGKGEQRLFFGELVSLDLKTRCGTLRYEHNDMVAPFTVLPYAELQHHAASGDLQDFRIGERCLFRLHQDNEGKWTWLTYIGDDMAFLANHNSYYWVDALDGAMGQITISRANGAKKEPGEKGVVLQTDAETRYWKAGKPAAFNDIKVGDRLRARVRGVGKGKDRVCLEVSLDDESLKKLQAEQKAVHSKRMETEGLPAYVDAREGKMLRLTLFAEGKELAKDLKTGQKVRVAPAGMDRKTTAEPTTGTVTEIRKDRRLHKVAVMLNASADALSPPGLARVWVDR
jgi:hypothetical protein